VAQTRARAVCVFALWVSGVHIPGVRGVALGPVEMRVPCVPSIIIGPLN